MAKVTKGSTYVVIKGSRRIRITKASAYVLLDSNTAGSLDVTKTVTLAWNVGTPASPDISRELTLVWNINDASVSQSVQLEWDIYPVASDVELSLPLQWNVTADAPGTVYAELTLLWDIEEESGDVLKSLALTWDLAQSYSAPDRLVVPDYPIVETWNWSTAVFRSANGREQRRAYLQRPVITQQFEAPAFNDRDFQQTREMLEVNADTLFPVPMYQYYDYIAQPATVGETRLYFVSQRLNLIAGQYIAIIPNAEPDDDRDPILAPVTAVYPDGCDLGIALTADVDDTFSVCPVLFSRMSANGATEALSVHAITSYNFIAAERELDFIRAANAATIPTIDGTPILARFISSNSSLRETYISGLDVLDNGMAPPAILKNEPTRRQQQLTFIANRETDAGAMDYWRRFADTVKGQQKAFGLSTFRPDAYPQIEPQAGDTVIDLLGRAFYDVYSQGGYFGLSLGTGARLAIEYVKVTEVELIGNNTRCTLAAPLVGNGYDVVSFVMLVRLSEDKITLTHDDAKSVLQFNIQMVRA